MEEVLKDVSRNSSWYFSEDDVKREINDFYIYKMKVLNEMWNDPELSPNSEIFHIRDYMNNTKESTRFYSMDKEELYDRYIKEVNLVSSAIGNDGFTEKEKILNALEYTRFMCCYENFPSGSISDISQSGLNAAILGKGVCASQAFFLRDVLRSSGVNSIECQNYMDASLFTEDQKAEKSINHMSTLSILQNGNVVYLDPTNYSGSAKKLRMSSEEWPHVSTKKVFGYGNDEYYTNLESYNKIYNPIYEQAKKLMGEEVSERKSIFNSLEVSDEEILKARSAVSSCIIGRYRIDEISDELGIKDAKTDLEKQLLILGYVENNIVSNNTDRKMNFRTVLIGDKEIEVSKLMELFYIANDIPYEICDISTKGATEFKLNIDGKEYFLRSDGAFDNTKNENTLTEITFYRKTDGNAVQFITQESEEKYNEYMDLRAKTQEVAIGVPAMTDHGMEVLYEPIQEEDLVDVSDSVEEMLDMNNMKLRKNRRDKFNFGLSKVKEFFKSGREKLKNIFGDSKEKPLALGDDVIESSEYEYFDNISGLNEICSDDEIVENIKRREEERELAVDEPQIEEQGIERTIWDQNSVHV
ncbi:MAG: hypothetical protein Q4D02_02150 [Clostridia bacterium]|nr:hypothetical protein [Clostridia bacterium]